MTSHHAGFHATCPLLVSDVSCFELIDLCRHFIIACAYRQASAGEGIFNPDNPKPESIASAVYGGNWRLHLTHLKCEHSQKNQAPRRCHQGRISITTASGSAANACCCKRMSNHIFYQVRERLANAAMAKMSVLQIAELQLGVCLFSCRPPDCRLCIL